MKLLLTLLLAAGLQCCFAQKILVPYRSAKQFGLADEKGKIITDPQYDYVSWMEGAWFETGKKIVIKDTIETSPRNFYFRNTKANLTGLIHNGKIILQDEPFKDYEIVARKMYSSYLRTQAGRPYQRADKKIQQPGQRAKSV